MPKFRDLFEKFARYYGCTIRSVITAILKRNQVTEVKEYLRVTEPDIIAALEAEKEDVLLSEVIRKKYARRFPGIGLLEDLAKEFAKGLPEVTQSLVEFNKERQRFAKLVPVRRFLAEIKEKQTALRAKVSFVKMKLTATSKILNALC